MSKKAHFFRKILGIPIPSFLLDFATIASDFTFTRASSATRVNENGLIETVTDLGSEEVINGGFDTDSDWAKETGWVIQNGYAESTTLSTRSIYQDIGSAVIGKTYQITYTILETNGGNFRFTYGGVNGTTRNSVGTYTQNIVATSASDGNIYFDALNAMIGKIDNVSVKEVAVEDDVPRIDYTTGEAAFLLEPTSTNFIPYSEDFTQWTASFSMVVASNNAISPDGSQNATLLTANQSNQFIYLTAFASANSTISLYIKRKTGTGDIELSNNGGSTYTTLSVTNEWNRVQVTFAAATSQTVLKINTSGDEVYIWGAQLEQLPYATSYIPTSGSTATRAAETCVDATPTINSEEGVLYAEISALADDLDSRLIMLSDGTNSNRIFMGYWLSSNEIIVLLQVGGVTQIFSGTTSYDILDFHKVAFKYKENDFALWVDGVEVLTDTSGITFPIGTLTELDFDSNGIAPFYGNTKDLRIYTEALTDEQLTELTTI